MQVIEQWNKDNERYYIIQINDKEYCNVKRTVYGYYYPIECKNGKDIYADSVEEGIRMMTREENDIILSLCRKYDNIMLKKNIGMLF